MSKAVVCPICHGTGKVENIGNTVAEKTCHGCNGKGWVEVGGLDYYAPYPIWPPYQPSFPWPTCPTISWTVADPTGSTVAVSST